MSSFAERSTTDSRLQAGQTPSPPQKRVRPSLPHPTRRCSVVKPQLRQLNSTIEPMTPPSDVRVSATVRGGVSHVKERPPRGAQSATVDNVTARVVNMTL